MGNPEDLWRQIIRLLVYHLATGVRKKGQATKYVNSTLSSAEAPAPGSRSDDLLK